MGGLQAGIRTSLFYKEKIFRTCYNYLRDVSIVSFCFLPLIGIAEEARTDFIVSSKYGTNIILSQS